MSLLQPTFNQPQSELTEKLNSGLYWVDEDICSALFDETFRFLEIATTALHDHLANSDDLLQPSETDHLAPHPTEERVGCGDFTTSVCGIPLTTSPEDLQLYVIFSSSPYTHRLMPM